MTEKYYIDTDGTVYISIHELASLLNKSIPYLERFIDNVKENSSHIENDLDSKNSLFIHECDVIDIVHNIAINEESLSAMALQAKFAVDGVRKYLTEKANFENGIKNNKHQKIIDNQVKILNKLDVLDDLVNSVEIIKIKIDYLNMIDRNRYLSLFDHNRHINKPYYDDKTMPGLTDDLFKVTCQNEEGGDTSIKESPYKLRKDETPKTMDVKVTT